MANLLELKINEFTLLKKIIEEEFSKVIKQSLESLEEDSIGEEMLAYFKRKFDSSNMKVVDVEVTKEFQSFNVTFQFTLLDNNPMEISDIRYQTNQYFYDKENGFSHSEDDFIGGFVTNENLDIISESERGNFNNFGEHLWIEENFIYSDKWSDSEILGMLFYLANIRLNPLKTKHIKTFFKLYRMCEFLNKNYDYLYDIENIRGNLDERELVVTLKSGMKFLIK